MLAAQAGVGQSTHGPRSALGGGRFGFVCSEGERANLGFVVT